MGLVPIGQGELAGQVEQAGEAGQAGQAGQGEHESRQGSWETNCKG